MISRTARPQGPGEEPEGAFYPSGIAASALHNKDKARFGLQTKTQPLTPPMKMNRPWLRTSRAPAMFVLALLCGNGLAELPVVSIAATRPATSEPRPDVRIIPGKFTISRDSAGEFTAR